MKDLFKFSSNFGLSKEEQGLFQQIIGIEQATTIIVLAAGDQIRMHKNKIAVRVVNHLLGILGSFSDGRALENLIRPLLHSVVMNKLLDTKDGDLSFQNQNSFSLPISELEKLGYKTQDEVAMRLNEIWSVTAKITFDKDDGFADDWIFYIELIY